MKYYLLSFVYFLSFLVSSAQEQYTVREYYNGLAIVVLNDKYGFVDKNKNVVVPIKYDDVEKFQEDYAVVGLDGKYGYINRQGEEVIPLQFSGADSFREGRARVWKNESTGFINKKGEIIVPIQYISRLRTSFHNGFAVIFDRNKCWFVNTKGKRITPIEYDYAFDFSDGLAAVKLNNKWGFINTKGKVVIPIKYDWGINAFQDERAIVNNGKTVIDKKGREIVTAEYDYISSFDEGLAFVRRGEECGFIDKEGKEVIPLHLQYSNRHYRPIFDKNINDTIPIDYQIVTRGIWFNEGLADVMLNNKWGFIDKQGNIVIPCQYDVAYSGFENGYAEVWIGREHYLIDKQGNIVAKVERGVDVI